MYVYRLLNKRSKAAAFYVNIVLCFEDNCYRLALDQRADIIYILLCTSKRLAKLFTALNMRDCSINCDSLAIRQTSFLLLMNSVVILEYLIGVLQSLLRYKYYCFYSLSSYQVSIYLSIYSLSSISR